MGRRLGAEGRSVGDARAFERGPHGVLTEYQRVRTTQSEGNSCRAGAEAGGPPAGVSGPGPRWPRRLQVLAVEVAGGRQVWLVF